MHAQAAGNPLITLTEATKITPGRPSTNCLWRWCRRGVLSRGGERVRLEHQRIGGKIFTAPDWLEEFGRTAPWVTGRRPRRRSRRMAQRQASLRSSLALLRPPLGSGVWFD